MASRYIPDTIRNYAAFDRTDPFALARAVTHHRLGMHGYQAAPFKVHRSYRHPITGKTVEYTVTDYRNISRP